MIAVWFKVTILGEKDSYVLAESALNIVDEISFQGLIKFSDATQRIRRILHGVKAFSYITGPRLNSHICKTCTIDLYFDGFAFKRLHEEAAWEGLGNLKNLDAKVFIL